MLGLGSFQPITTHAQESSQTQIQTNTQSENLPVVNVETKSIEQLTAFRSRKCKSIFDGIWCFRGNK